MSVAQLSEQGWEPVAFLLANVLDLVREEDVGKRDWCTWRLPTWHDRHIATGQQIERATTNADGYSENMDSLRRLGGMATW